MIGIRILFQRLHNPHSFDRTQKEVDDEIITSHSTTTSTALNSYKNRNQKRSPLFSRCESRGESILCAPFKATRARND